MWANKGADCGHLHFFGNSEGYVCWMSFNIQSSYLRVEHPPNHFRRGWSFFWSLVLRLSTFLDQKSRGGRSTVDRSLKGYQAVDKWVTLTWHMTSAFPGSSTCHTHPPEFTGTVPSPCLGFSSNSRDDSGHSSCRFLYPSEWFNMYIPPTPWKGGSAVGCLFPWKVRCLKS